MHSGDFDPGRDGQTVGARFTDYLNRRVVADARGDDSTTSSFAPSGRYWLGRLAPEHSVLASSLGSRGQRLEPCAAGVQFRPAGDGPWTLDVDVSMHVWRKGEEHWQKSSAAAGTFQIVVQDGDERSFLEDELGTRLDNVDGASVRTARIDVEVAPVAPRGSVLSVTIVNATPAGTDADDPNLYEVRLSVGGVALSPFEVTQLPDSFRYDRNVPAYGINGGAEVDGDGRVHLVDAVEVDTRRRSYWNVSEPEPDLRFTTLADDPLPSLTALVDAYRRWGEEEWNATQRRARDEEWDRAVVTEVQRGHGEYLEELRRLQAGLDRLRDDRVVRRAFRLMNRAIRYSARGRYEGWRPFQLGFVLSALPELGGQAEDVCDVIWFATGGGKTETYLGLVVATALYDRIVGKSAGITAWSRFPLRMLSLQQTQRFADAMAGAERVRREEGIGGDPFSVGFFVGQGATPNRLSDKPTEGQPDPYDPEMPRGYKVLLRCPFCASEELRMEFELQDWRLNHVCDAADCPWPGTALPFFVVDDEIFRFLPTTVVGTLDKAASIATQASMRGFVGPPHGRCSREGHGFTYAARSSRPKGCLVPDCQANVEDIGVPRGLIAPSLRLQDELHLLRDTLGAVDSHYEGLLDHLQDRLTGTTAKVVASSATLAGYQRQSEVLYGRRGRVFPVQGPSVAKQFWTAEQPEVLRRFVAVAPRGVTIEYATDRLNTALQTAVRDLLDDPDRICADARVPVAAAPWLLSVYGTDVVYGSTLRDLEAVDRSLATGQVAVDGPLNSASLTGRTPFSEVMQTLGRLTEPEGAFRDRIHIVTASSMMSHGVDVDRLNVMVMLGLPLTTAEFIQTTARIGRRWPGLVYVLHKIGRERDTGVYRSFQPYVRQGDRFVEAVPVTRRSVRVLDSTVAGLAFARVTHVHEPAIGSLTMASRLRRAVESGQIDMTFEADEIIDALRAHDVLDEPLREALRGWFDRFARALRNGLGKWPENRSPTGRPMMSLRDVEEQAPVRD